MALSFVDTPYLWTLRGQRLLFRVSSTNTAQTGFKYGVIVTASSKQYEFFVDRSPATNDLLFDLASVVKLYNDESTPDMHTARADDPWSEPIGNSWDSYNVSISEWWQVNGVLTENVGSAINATRFLLNGYYQPKLGYKPSVDAGDTITRLALNAPISRAWSDRFTDTHTWFNTVDNSNAANRSYIPCLSTDYGLLYVPLKTSLDGNVSYMYIVFFNGLGGAPATYEHLLTGTEVIGVGVYPMNINDAGTFPNSVKPQTYPTTWTHYIINFRETSGGQPRSMTYCFYNAQLYGQSDCRFEYVRLAWVNSRSGWDYFNFIKKNEITNEIERKQYKQLLLNNFGTFDNWQRQLTDRETMNTQTLTITSDWIQENEFVFLRSLLLSNQVDMLDTTGSKSLGYRTPVSIVDTSFTEKKERNGKLYNVTLKLKYSQDYWT
jgi:hypothetical protein